MRVLCAMTVILAFAACTAATVRSTVDSFGETSLSRTDHYYFDLGSLPLIEKQGALDCREAARDSGLMVEEALCKDCRLVRVHMRISSNEEVLRSTPGFASAWAGYGRRSRFGTGLGTANDLESYPEAWRSVDLSIFADPDGKTTARELQIRSLGSENSVSSVAYEMCKAAFEDYPSNIKGKFYDVKRVASGKGS